MGIATIIFELRSRGRAVACAALVAILAGAAIGYNVTSFPPKSRQYTVGTASAQVLVDTPQSQIVAVSPPGSDTIATRAVLLASLMVSGPIKNVIAQQAGLQPSQLYGLAESGSGIAGSAASSINSQSPPARGYVLRTTILSDTALASSPGGGELPIIDIETQAPDTAGAARLANAAVVGLQQYVASQANADGLAASQRLQVKSFAAIQAVESTRGPGISVMLMVVIVLFVVGCALILLIPRLKRVSRGVSTGGAFHEIDSRFDGMPASVGTIQDPPPGVDHTGNVPARSDHIQDVPAGRDNLRLRRWQPIRHGIPGRDVVVGDIAAGGESEEGIGSLIDAQRDLAR